MKFGTNAAIATASKYDSVLDVGCGRGDLLKRIIATKRVGVDACEKALEVANANNNGVEYRCFDLKDIDTLITDNFECVIGVDIIEHSEKQDGYKLIKECERIATKCIIFFLPVGLHPQNNDPWGMGNEYYQKHRSTWSVDDMEKLGYEISYNPTCHRKFKGTVNSMAAMWCLKYLK